MRLLDYLKINSECTDFHDYIYSSGVVCVDYYPNDPLKNWHSLFCVALYEKVQVTDYCVACWSDLIVNNYEKFKEFSNKHWATQYDDEDDFIYEWIKELHLYLAGMTNNDMYRYLYEFMQQCVYKERDLGKNRYYFSFGSAECYPYQGGHLIVKADTADKAIEKYRSKYPDKVEGLVNCAFVYTESEWYVALLKLPMGCRMRSDICHEIIK